MNKNNFKKPGVNGHRLHASDLKKGIGIESEKVYKQFRNQKVWKQVKDGAQWS